LTDFQTYFKVIIFKTRTFHNVV